MDYASVKEAVEVTSNPDQVERMQALFDGRVVSVLENGSSLYYRYCDVDGLKVSDHLTTDYVVLTEPYDFTGVLEDYGCDSAPRVVTILH